MKKSIHLLYILLFLVVSCVVFVSPVFSSGDIVEDSWVSKAPLPSPTVLASAAATTGLMAPERIYVFGADADLPYWQLTFRNFITQSYDPKTDNWKACASMPTGRFDASVAVVNDTVYVIGGFTIEFPIDEFTLNPSIAYSTVNEQYIPIGHIPEFTSWIILPLFFVATLIGVVIKRKVFRPT